MSARTSEHQSRVYAFLSVEQPNQNKVSGKCRLLGRANHPKESRLLWLGSHLAYKHFKRSFRWFQSSRKGFGFVECRFSVMRKPSIRLLLAFACRNNLSIHHVDVKTAYPNADLAEEVYIDQPFGYEAREKLVCRLNKAIYGLKQSAKGWNEKLSQTMEQTGLKPFASEECIFASKGNELIVGVYIVTRTVDRWIVGGPRLTWLQWGKNADERDSRSQWVERIYRSWSLPLPVDRW